jgi:transposase
MNDATDCAVAWLGLDVHARFSVLTHLDESGQPKGCWRFVTSGKNLIDHLKAIPAGDKRLAVEECGLGRWVAQVARPHVQAVLVCDPRHNRLISQSHRKCDEQDALHLAQLYRLGSLKAVWQPTEDDRAVFKCAVQAYLDAVQRQTSLKLQLKAHYRQWGLIPTGQDVYHRQKREVWLVQLTQPGLRPQLEILYFALDSALEAEKRARRHMLHLGQAYPEISRLRTVPGVGAIGAHIFVAYIQTPSRFATPKQLFRYCRLGIRERTSDGKPLAWQSLDRSGHGVLKSISHRAVLSALKARRGAVYQSYQQSLARVADPVHARLNTQRKILWTLLSLWAKQKEFDPKRFLQTVPTTT